MKKKVLIGICIVLTIPCIAQQPKSIVELQKEKDRQIIEALKNKIDVMKKDLRNNNKKFQVDITEAIKHKISEITGLKKPLLIDNEAKVQSRQ